MPKTCHFEHQTLSWTLVLTLKKIHNSNLCSVIILKQMTFIILTTACSSRCRRQRLIISSHHPHQPSAFPPSNLLRHLVSCSPVPPTGDQASFVNSLQGVASRAVAGMGAGEGGGGDGGIGWVRLAASKMLSAPRSTECGRSPNPCRFVWVIGTLQSLAVPHDASDLVTHRPQVANH